MKNALHGFAPKFLEVSRNELSIAHGQSVEPALSAINGLNTATGVRLPDEWQEADYRRATVDATVSNLVAWQVRVNREERGMTQAELASAMGTQQSAISRLEDTEGGDVMVSTLLKAAHAFDCALLVRFVSYDSFASLTSDVRPDRLYAPPFEKVGAPFEVKTKKRTRINHGNTRA